MARLDAYTASEKNLQNINNLPASGASKRPDLDNYLAPRLKQYSPTNIVTNLFGSISDIEVNYKKFKNKLKI